MSQIFVKNGKIIAFYEDFQEVSFSLHPEADSLKKVCNGLSLMVGDADPTIAHPEYLVNAPSDLPALYIHTVLSGGDGLVPPGIKNDGIDFLAASITVRQAADPESAIIPLSGNWRLLIRDSKRQE